MELTAAHRGYEYQDLLIATRLVDVMLGSVVKIHVDKKLVQDDIFDDLTTVDTTGRRERTQVKYTDRTDQSLTLATFTSDARSLRLDRVISAVLADRDGPDPRPREFSFRIVLCDTPPTDERLLAVLGPAHSDPGPFLHGMDSVRMRFHADALWERSRGIAAEPPAHNPAVFLQLGKGPVDRSDLEWVCEHLVVELGAPVASLDLTEPGAAERLLLKRVQNEVGAGMYPNANRSAVDVAEALIRSARAARQGSMTVTTSELLRRTGLRSDFGAVARAHPVDMAMEVPRPMPVAKLVQHATDAADEGKIILLVGPPGQGKSWVCQQMINSLSDKEWLVAEHYCFLGAADGERLPRVHVESVFGSLLGRIAEYDPELISEQRPRFAAHEHALEDAVAAALQKRSTRRVALVVDGIDHVTRVLAGGPTVDPSFTLAQALATLVLPPGSTLIVLSQPGNHLEPLEVAGAVTVPIPRLTDSELRQLAVQQDVLRDKSGEFRLSGCSPLLTDEEAISEFVATLSGRSAGNALYATYLCREALRNPATMAEPSATVRSLPQFDGSLRTYYEHIRSSLGDQGAWVADVIALLDFPVSRNELKEIRPDMAHRVDQAVEALRPVLLERATQAGVRVYHESFARFLRLPFQDNAGARTALLDRIIEWLEHKGIFEDSRAFRFLLPILSEANYHQKVVDAVGRDFVVKSIAAGFPASAIVENLATSISSAACIDNWPAVVRYVEMSRSAETYQEERFESAMVGFVDVIGSMLGADTLAERLLHDGRPTMAARSGLQLCAALDALGAVAPWREYMLAFLKEDEADNTNYDETSDRKVSMAWLRGRLRLASVKRGTPPDASHALALSSTDQGGGRDLDAPIKLEQLARRLDKGTLPAADVVGAILDTFGFPAVLELIEKLTRPSTFYLALSEKIAAGTVSDSEGDALYWASRAADCGLPPGSAPRLIAIGVDVGEVYARPIEEARARLLELTREVQDSSVRWETGRLSEWMDACAIAARKDPFGLSAAEALLEGPGWYTCWLRFTIALVVAEAASADEQSRSGLEALLILTEVQDPFLGEPRACDLYPIHGLIDETIRRAISLLDGQAWEEAFEVLNRVSTAISTTITGELGGPMPRDRLLHLAVETATATRRAAAQHFVNNEIENGGEGRYYSDLAEYRLVAARLALTADDLTEASRHWIDACGLLIAYGWHKDITIYELLDPLPALSAVDPAHGRMAVAKLQPLCKRVPDHTDGRETSHARSRWWTLLAAADPCALAGLIQPRLLSSCNDPNWLLHGARSDLWRGWHHRADPIVAGALRLTLEEPLDQNDETAFARLADISDGTGNDHPSRLLVALLARIDERPFKYSDSNSKALLDRDRKRVDALNVIAGRAGVPRLAPLPTPPVEADNPATSSRRSRGLQPVAHLRDRVGMMFPPGAVGVAQAIGALRKLQYEEARSDCSVDRFANILGYRIIEHMEAGQVKDAETTLILIADSGGFDKSSELLKALAEGFERHGQGSLAAVAYALAWTRARGRGGWMRFGGETEIESLLRATQFDRALVLKTIAGEVERIVSRGLGTHGVAQALMYGFAKGGLSTSSSVAFDIWDEAFAIIADRAPRVAAGDDPVDVYVAPDSDSGAELPGDIDTAFATAAVAGLAHPGREQKRRSLVATQVLIDEHASAVAAALGSALSSLSDPATLTWLLRVIELAGEKAAPIVSESRSVLIELAGRPHLTVRALARRLLSSGEVPLALSSDPDTELLEQDHTGLLLPFGVKDGQEDTAVLNGMIDEIAGVRLSRAERILPRLGDAVRKRADTVLKSEEHKRRRTAQFSAYCDKLEKRWPDVFLASYEAVEDAIQRAAAGARAARLMNGEPVADPVGLEESLAQALLNDPEIPLAVERTRQPRPDIPPPPLRGDPLWRALCARAKGRGIDETGVEAASESGDGLFGTTAILSTDVVPTLADGPYRSWRLVAAVERRVISRPDRRSKEDEIAQRHRVIELRVSGDRQALTLPPLARGDLRTWSLSHVPDLSGNERIRSQPVIGSDSALCAADDGHHGLGIQRHLLTPIPWLFANLTLKRRSAYFVLDDDDGQALALITWRTEYETSDYHIAWPRLCGAGLVVRSDAFDSLVHATQGSLIFRDFLAGNSSLCS